LYQALYERAVTLDQETHNYPLGTRHHDIILVPDIGNPYDKHATLVKLQIYDEHDPLYQWNGADMGFIPMKISGLIAPNRAQLHSGRILKVKNAVHVKYYSAKVVMSYGTTQFSGLDPTTIARFNAIVEE